MVQQKASQRLEFEGLSKAKEVVDPSSKFFNNRERYAMDRYAYFMCAKCSQPYFAGQVVFYFCFVLFCFVLFCFVLFCFVLFCFVLFCFVLFCFVLFCFVLFCFVLFCW